MANTIPSNAYTFSMIVCNGVIIDETDKGTFRTTNNGISWESININHWASGLISNGNIIYAYGNYPGGIYKSTDYGSSWQNYGLIYIDVNDICFKDNYVLASADNKVLRSSDDGATWTQVNDVELQGGISHFQVMGNNIFASTYSEIFLSTNNGNKWKRVYTNNLSVDIRVLASKNNIIFAGSYLWGLLRSTNYGDSWTTANHGIASTIVNTLCAKGDDIYAGTYYNGGISLTTDFGETWNVVNNGIESVGICYAVASKGNYVFIGDSFEVNNTNHNDVLVTSNNGANWYSPFQISSTVNALTVAGESVFAGVYCIKTNIYQSFDNGQNWNAVRGISSQVEVTSLLSTNDSTIFALAQGIWRTTDKGRNWVLCDSGNTFYSLSSICGSGKNIVASRLGSEIYVSTNSGDNWVTKQNDLQNMEVRSLAIMNNTLFAGMWYYDGIKGGV